MNRLLACRVCLAYDTRLCSIMDSQFRDIYEKLVGESLDMEDMLPTSVCYICFSLMKKMLQFRDRSQKANQILQQMISSGLEPSVSFLDILLKDQIGISWNLGISNIDRTTTTSGEVEFKVKIESVESEIEIDRMSDRNKGAAPLEKGKLEKNEAEKELIDIQTHLIKTEKDEEHRENEEDKKKILYFNEVEMATSNIISENLNQSVFHNNDTVTPPKDIFTSDLCKNEYQCKILLESHMKKSHVMEFTRKDSITSDLNVTNEFKSTNISKVQEIQNNDNQKEKDRNYDLTTHVRVHTKEKPFKCFKCEKGYSCRSTLSKHLKVHTQENPFKCAVCNKCFSFSNGLTAHLRVHNKEKPFKCDICEKSFTQNCNLGRHLRVHTKEKPYKCDKCEKGFYCSSDLTRHLGVHTQKNPFKCAICEKSYSFNTDLTRHLRVHTKEKPFKCDVCAKGFFLSSDLTRHLRVHTKEQPFKCALCEEGFSSITDLSKHVRVHTIGNPFRCEICKTCFSDISSLNIHLRVHNIEKTFKCDICQKSFAHRGTLTNHIKVHTKEKPFKCD